MEIKTIDGRIICNGNTTSLKELIEQNVKEGKDLSYADIPFIGLLESNLENALLMKAVLSGSSLDRSNLSNASLAASDLSNCSLVKTNFEKAKCIRTIFSLANIEGANFKESNLEKTMFTESQLNNAKFNNANIFKGNFSKSNLGLAKFDNADLTKCNFTRANIKGASFKNANLANTIFTDANLDECDFTDANIVDAIFIGASMKNVKGINPEYVTPLYMLFDQKGPIRAYLGTNEIKKGAKIFPSDENSKQGIKLNTLDQIIRKKDQFEKIAIVEFDKKDIIEIPTASVGEIIVSKARMIKEKIISKPL